MASFVESILREHLHTIKEDTLRKGDGVGMFTHRTGNTFGYYYILKDSRLWKPLDEDFSLSEKHTSGKMCIGVCIPKKDSRSKDEYTFEFVDMD